MRIVHGNDRSSGVYGTTEETFVVGRSGTVWVIQSPDLREGESYRRCAMVPQDAGEILDLDGLEIPDECLEDLDLPDEDS